MNPISLGRLPALGKWSPTLLPDKFRLASLLEKSQPRDDLGAKWFKPRVLAKADPGKEDCLDNRYTTLPAFDSLPLGEVSPFAPMEPESELCRSLAVVAEENGFFPRKVRLYGSRDIIAVRGSIDYHTDDGLGFCCSLLAWADPLANDGIAYGRAASLAGPSRSIDVEVGDVFVFDGNRPHAWISNCNCILAQLTVGKRREKFDFDVDQGRADV